MEEMEQSRDALPLSGIRVLDLSRVLAGPYCGSILAMLGADVIKVEDRKGDEGRHWPPHREGLSGSFVGMNVNKRSVVVDLKHEAGREVLKRLATDADVLVENFKTGTMERFGLGYDVLSALNPRLVYTAVSAFGRSGPRAEDLGYEALMQAYSGAMNMTGEPDGDPVRCGVSFLDMSTGVMSALATVVALYRREQTGRGGLAESSLLQTALGLMTPQLSNYLQHGLLPKRLGTAHPQVVPYQSYRTADDYIFIASGNQNLWEKLCRALQAEHLTDDPRFKDNATRVQHRDACIAAVSDQVARWNTAELEQTLRAAGVPCSRVNTYDDLMADGQVEALGALAAGEDRDYGAFRVPGLPFTMNGAREDTVRRAPRLGEHTRAVLREAGYEEAEVVSLLEQGAVAGE